MIKRYYLSACSQFSLILVMTIFHRYQPYTSLYATCSNQRLPPFLRALSLYGITKRAPKYCIPILTVFKNQISQYTIYLLNCALGYLCIFTIYSSVSKGVPVSVLVFLLFPLSPFSFLQIKRSHGLEVNIHVDP